MNCLITNKKIFNILSLTLSIIFGTNSLVHASEKNPKKAIDLIEKKMVSLVKEKKFDEAYALYTQHKLNDNQSNFYWKGLFLGSGVLSSGRNSCEAILSFERAYTNRKQGLTALNFEYGGKWASVAAIEGNRDALFDLGFATLYMQKNTPIILFYDDTLQVKQAYQYYYNAALLGHIEAKKRMAILVKKHPYIDFTKYQKKIQFKQIHCPVRQYDNVK